MPAGGGRARPSVEPTRQPHTSTPSPTGVKGAGGTGGHGRASRHGAERSEAAKPRGRPGPPAPATPVGPQATPAIGRAAGSRVAISRAGRPRGGRRSVRATNNKQEDRSPPAHTAARPIKAVPPGTRNTSNATDSKAARPHRGRAAQQVSETHRRITTMSGSPRPLSWRTLEIPSVAATSFAVPSMRGSS